MHRQIAILLGLPGAIRTRAERSLDFYEPLELLLSTFRGWDKFGLALPSGGHSSCLATIPNLRLARRRGPVRALQLGAKTTPNSSPPILADTQFSAATARKASSPTRCPCTSLMSFILLTSTMITPVRRPRSSRSHPIFDCSARSLRTRRRPQFPYRQNPAGPGTRSYESRSTPA